jgi:hypothetical protein
MSFDVELNIAEENILKSLGQIVIDVGVEIMTTLTSPPPVGTPRKTGWASSNWLYGITPATSPVGTNTTVPTALSAQYASFSDLMNRNLYDLRSYYIYNKVPYIGKLNSASTPSKQSPPMFIEMAIQRGVKNVRLNILRNRRGSPQK